MDRKKMTLKQAMSLSEGGGIPWSGNRTRLRENHTALIVGVGQTGTELLIRIKDQVRNKMLLPTDENGRPVADAPGNMKFLAISNHFYGAEVRYGTTSLKEDEICDIVWPDPREAEIARSDNKYGSQMTDAYLAGNSEKVVKSIREKVINLERYRSSEKMNIIILGGISETTASESLIDIGYILRRITKEQVYSTAISGFFFMSGKYSIEGNTSLYGLAESFAFLKELNYWMDREYNSEYYRKRFFAIELNEKNRPFDNCYIFDELPREEAEKSLYLEKSTQIIFLFLSEKVSVWNDGWDVNRVWNDDWAVNRLNRRENLWPVFSGYMSAGYGKMEIPQKEIATLLVARMFERMEKHGEEDPEQESRITAEWKQQTSFENIRELLYEDVDPKPYFDRCSYKDIWNKENTALSAASVWLERAQIRMQINAERFQECLKEKIENRVTLNIWNDTGTLFPEKQAEEKRFNTVFSILESGKTECEEREKWHKKKVTEAAQDLKQKYEKGASATAFAGRKEAKEYRSILDEWVRASEAVFLNERMIKLLKSLQEYIDQYYKNTILPLADRLAEISEASKDNITVLEKMKKEGSMPENWIINPLEFENLCQEKIKVELNTAERSFLFWIKDRKEILTDKNTEITEIQRIFAEFTETYFCSMCNGEKIISHIWGTSGDFQDGVKNTILALLRKVQVMYCERADLAEQAENYTFLFIPKSWPTVYEFVASYFRNYDRKNPILVMKTERTDCMFAVKCKEGFPICSNRLIGEMEVAYEEQVQKKEREDQLPSPYIEPLWSEGYVCERTGKRNEECRRYIDKAVEYSVITEEEGSIILKLPDMKLAEELQLTVSKAKNTSQKIEQLSRIRRDIWESGSKWTLCSSGSYLIQKDPDEQYGLLYRKMGNIRENLLRSPETLKEIKDALGVVEKIAQLERDITSPQYYARAVACHFLTKTEEKGVVYDNGVSIQLLLFDKEQQKGLFYYPEYRIYRKFERFLVSSSLRMEIDIEMMKKKSDPTIQEEIENIYLPQYTERMKQGMDERLCLEPDELEEWKKKMDFYHAVTEELQEILKRREGISDFE